ncbi:MAG: hypothetical protein NTV86_07960, partial [Planctomycetota bacterium]|nr:hypothetical protein [Planctomycetota bacterium]
MTSPTFPLGNDATSFKHRNANARVLFFISPGVIVPTSNLSSRLSVQSAIGNWQSAISTVRLKVEQRQLVMGHNVFRFGGIVQKCLQNGRFLEKSDAENLQD